MRRYNSEQALAERTPEELRALVMERIVRPVSYTHLRAHETVLDLVCRLLLDKKHQINQITFLNQTERHRNKNTSKKPTAHTTTNT